jgi:hypothetical protein
MMNTYRLIKNPDNGKDCGVLRNGADSIPFAPDNSDYQQFKKEVLAGAELQDADGNVMTQEQADAFIATLP